jgi:hypothetical protein
MNEARKAELEARVAKLTERAANLKAMMAETNQEIWAAQAELQEAETLSSAEIGRRNRALMFGENDEAFPSQEEWSRIVD